MAFSVSWYLRLTVQQPYKPSLNGKILISVNDVYIALQERN
jgi:hypothetical protein